MVVQGGVAFFNERGSPVRALHEYLAHKKPRSPRTLQWDYAYAPTAVLGGWGVVVSEMSLHQAGEDTPSRGAPPWSTSQRDTLQGYLAHKNTPPPVGPP